MSRRYSLVSDRQRHLKWSWLDPVEQILMAICGVALAGFSSTVFFDVVTRSLGHPVLWVQEVTMTFFVYGIFIGTAAAARRNDHLYLTAIAEALRGTPRLLVETFTRLVVLGAALCMVWFGFINFLQGFGSFRMPSMTPIASLYAAIPFSGALVALFTVEQLLNGWRNGFEGREEQSPENELDSDRFKAAT
ncbi:MAG: TRAP transporter small permease [Alphaproteobacteria bacterium]|nr:TRAP transporter small permease [Alphaproteobacteria bacterium]MBV9017226.1 TRAP transporter small permease [Alphaproteobacteria bacterium]MBV9153155.1 TRAP transporter small permease [Alphaproteobacteria bacterium]MBV9585326.1 TRAP transporter small permease [Alphaproteobacteria bacterium]MBV9968179.1 TRAP transporter small permease [Alphaproteobacteria bacterium]